MIESILSSIAEYLLFCVKCQCMVHTHRPSSVPYFRWDLDILEPKSEREEFRAKNDWRFQGPKQQGVKGGNGDDAMRCEAS